MISESVSTVPAVTQVAVPRGKYPERRACHASPLMGGGAVQRGLAAACVVFGLGSVWPLLAWVFGLGPFTTWYWAFAVPGLVFIALAALVLERTGGCTSLRVALTAGALGGLIGTLGYDLARAPFVALGYRLFAPISSYGVLIVDGSYSNPMTETLGWAYNFENGIGFGVAYGILALGRRWWYAIPFALLLETTTVITPYADYYSLRGQLGIIVIAYAAHVVYGVALGQFVAGASRWRSPADSFAPFSWIATALIAGLMLWQRPWTALADAVPLGTRGQPVALVQDARMRPEWVRLPLGRCLQLTNRDGSAYTLSQPADAILLPADGTSMYCFRQPGVSRVQLNGAPYSGGFVIVDAAMGENS